MDKILHYGNSPMVTAVILFFLLIEAVVFYRGKPFKKKLSFLFFSFAAEATLCFFIQLISPIMNHYFWIAKPDAKKYIFSAVCAMCVVVLHLFIFVLARKFTEREAEIKHKKIYKTFNVLGIIFVSLGSIILFTGIFITSQWAGVRPEQLIANLATPTEGTERSVYYAAFENVFVALGLIVTCAYVFFKNFSIKICKKRILPHVKSIICFVLSFCFFVYSFIYIEKNLHVSEFYTIFFDKSDFIENNYVDPKTAHITFPETKRNIIYIYLESMENSYLSKNLGGFMETNLMPELTELSYEGITFSNTEKKFGGPMQIVGTSWSMASMVNQNLGIPMKVPGKHNTYGQKDNFINGAYGLGEVLKEQGYNNSIVVGANSHFGSLDYLLQTHGDFKIIDHPYAIEHNMLPKDYYVFWGYEDDKLYQFAKDEATSLYNTGKPFYLIVETADTHMPDGYLPDSAPKPYDSQYANAIAYSTSQTVEFVRWIQQQPFYDNTTIILIGDHQSMAVDFFKDFDKGYLRTQYNLILNPADNVKDTDKSKYINRIYANFDMYPTALAAMGCEIEGDRLALGTNLFSDRETLLEEYGLENAAIELTKSSSFYNEKLLMDSSAAE